MRHSSNHDDPLVSAYYQFLLTTFGSLNDTQRSWMFPDAGYFSKDNVLQNVEFLFNRIYKKTFWPKSNRIIRLTTALDSKKNDLIQLADVLLGIANSYFEPALSFRQALHSALCWPRGARTASLCRFYGEPATPSRRNQYGDGQS
jgi:hypothetical protein